MTPRHRLAAALLDLSGNVHAVTQTALRLCSELSERLQSAQDLRLVLVSVIERLIHYAKLRLASASDASGMAADLHVLIF